MISALKRALAKNDPTPAPQVDQANTAQNNQVPSNTTTTFLNNGMHMISQSLQKKFSRGVNYNMKIVIRGDNNVGKSNLWLRLQGQAFKELYETSDEIKVANIQWSNKQSEDIVKVEIWDVVDRSKKKKNLTGGGMGKKNTGNGFVDPYILGAVEASLDAEFIDVYKSANGCIMIFDITKAWTWDYIERELPKVPGHLPVLVIGNFLDSQHHRSVEQDKCKYFLENLDRGNLSSSIRYTETSMRSGFGLKYLYKFFNIPFLQLQRENLMQQLETNANEMDQISEELTEHEEKNAYEYETFSDSLNSKRRQESELNAKDVLKDAKSLDEARNIATKKVELENAKILAESTDSQKMMNKALNIVMTKTGADQLINDQKPLGVSMSVTLDKHQITGNKNPIKGPNKIKDIQDFQIKETNEDELNQFLNMNKSNSQTHVVDDRIKDDGSDADDVVGSNPMVAGFKETIDSDDDGQISSVLGSNKINDKFLDLSDGEDNVVVDTLPAQFSALDFDFLENLNGQVVVVEEESVEKKKKKSSKKSKDKDRTKEKKGKKEKKIVKEEVNESMEDEGSSQIKQDLDYEEL